MSITLVWYRSQILNLILHAAIKYATDDFVAALLRHKAINVNIFDEVSPRLLYF
jgi:hypothetical protein